MSVDVDNPDEDSSVEFEGLADRLKAEPVSLDQADQRVADMLEHQINRMTELSGAKRPTKFVIDRSLPPETVVVIKGDTVTLSPDAHDAIQRHEARTQKFTRRSVKHTGETYKGS